ncbi:hypothetical protein CRENBAI_008128 [Crenichthys baileyi]|uniref:Uncharacterized protein n=1 Tax=Crenichthys baileyi TaxID=28760 RepID=A0AAV9R9T7_9TELE
MNSDPNPMSPPTPMNPDLNFPTGPPPKDTDIEHMPPNPNAMNPLPKAHGHTPTGELHARKPTKQHPQSASSRHSPPPNTPTASHPHHTARCDSQARALPNATLPPAHRRKTTDTAEHRAHNGTPNPTPRWDKHIRQEVPSQHQALGAAVPHHAPATTQTHHFTATATVAQPVSGAERGDLSQITQQKNSL